jgi:hypothetical protein
VNATVPTALAVAGTALMAVAIFGPFHRSSKDEAGQNVPESAASNGTSPWPSLLEASAGECDVPARIDLAEALGALQSAWSESILRQALETESDPGVRLAIAAALSSSQSLVT